MQRPRHTQQPPRAHLALVSGLATSLSSAGGRDEGAVYRPVRQMHVSGCEGLGAMGPIRERAPPDAVNRVSLALRGCNWPHLPTRALKTLQDVPTDSVSL